MKIKLQGRITEVGKVEEVKSGFIQRFVIEQQEVKDEFERVLARKQVFQLEVWAKERGNTKFVGEEMKGQIKSFDLYLNGDRSDKNGKTYFFLKLAVI